jgi:hypothetical protein
LWWLFWFTIWSISLLTIQFPVSIQEGKQSHTDISKPRTLSEGCTLCECSTPYQKGARYASVVQTFNALQVSSIAELVSDRQTRSIFYQTRKSTELKNPFTQLMNIYLLMYDEDWG